MQGQLILVLVIALVGILGLLWIIIKMRQEFLVKLSDLRRDMEKEHRIIRAHFNDYKLTVARTYPSISMFQEKIKSLKTSPESSLAVQAEREACAKLVEEWAPNIMVKRLMRKEIAKAIRNRV